MRLLEVPLRNILLCLAEEGLVFPLWSEEIRDEWIRSLLRNRSDLSKEKLERTHREMIRSFPNGLIRGYEAITPTLSQPVCPPLTTNMPSRNGFAMPPTSLNSSDITFRSNAPAEITSVAVPGTTIHDRVCKSIPKGKRSNAGSATSAVMSSPSFQQFIIEQFFDDVLFIIRLQ